MKCPYCQSFETKVVDKRESEDNVVTRRRRECLKCQKRFTTYERVDTVDLIIVKRNEEREQFDRHKLSAGIMKACEKRPVSSDDICRMVDEIETILRRSEGTEIPSNAVGELVMKMLRGIDEVAYVRFASVYRKFADVNEFIVELQRLKEGKDESVVRAEPDNDDKTLSGINVKSVPEQKQ